MDIWFWLTVGKNGSVRTTKGQPDLKWDEISIYVSLSVPIELFKRPTLSATIEIPKDKIPEQHINADTVNELQEVLKLQGFEVKLHIQEPEEED